jgi:hypothetical protein
MEEAELLVDAASRLSEPFLLVIVVILCLHYILIMTSSMTSYIDNLFSTAETHQKCLFLFT